MWVLMHACYFDIDVSHKSEKGFSSIGTVVKCEHMPPDMGTDNQTQVL